MDFYQLTPQICLSRFPLVSLQARGDEVLRPTQRLVRRFAAEVYKLRVITESLKCKL